jgi:adenine-specific DNA-methyltransferase
MAILNFKGKTFVQNHHLAVKYHQLVPKKDKSFIDKVNLNDNLIIHGDNLKALKALLPTYTGKVKCIYIDPPYNTGNEKWVYNDNVNSPIMQEWLGKVVDREDLTRHDKWLCMMMPRLKLLRELLSEDGVIFVSIDDNEVHHLRMLMDEVFGEGNFITNFIWKKKSTSTNVRGTQLSSLTDYVVCYGKTKEVKLNPRVRPRETRQYLYEDEEGKYRTTIIEKKHAGSYERESMRFSILGVFPRNGKRWQIGEEKARELEKRNRFVIDNGVAKLKIYDFEDKDTLSANPNLLD